MDITLPINLESLISLLALGCGTSSWKFCTSFVANLTNHASDIIYFTAAGPCQGGVGHINEKPHEYWIEKFMSSEFSLYINGQMIQMPRIGLFGILCFLKSQRWKSCAQISASLYESKTYAAYLSCKAVDS